MRDDVEIPSQQSAKENPRRSASRAVIAPISSKTPEESLDCPVKVVPIWLGSGTRAELMQMQERDPAIGDLVVLKSKRDDKPPWSDVRCKNTEVIGLWTQWEILHLRNQLLYWKWIDKMGREIFH